MAMGASSSFFVHSEDQESEPVRIPLGGNCFVTKRVGSSESENVSSKGLQYWTQPDSVCSIFFRLSNPESFNVSLRLRVPDGLSSIRVSFPKASQSYEIKDLEYRTFAVVPVGIFSANSSGYVQLELQGISRTGRYFADVSHLIVENITGSLQCIAHPNNFYFGRRGPSVHFRYKEPTESPVQYFYNEIRVPFGQDAIGAYFMACGFSEGYFGIQVNSSLERRVLFSVWSDYKTDDPGQVPEDYKVRLIKKSPGVIAQEFGAEGSGMQSFTQFNWKTEVTYRFLLYGSPLDENNTVFTAWVSSEEIPEWKLIASFMKPKKSVYLSSLYSFAENFVPETGHLERRVMLGNQWVRDAVKSKWYEVRTAIFTGDETSRKDRADFAGGAIGNQFYLRHCGFFDDKVKTNQQFTRDSSGINPPEISFPTLP